jgi:hypothetical protein
VLSQADDLALLMGRVFVAALFLPHGFHKLMTFWSFAASLGAKGVLYVLQRRSRCDVAVSYRRVRRVLISIASSRASQQTIIRPQKPATYRSDIISKRISPSYSMGRTRPPSLALQG